MKLTTLLDILEMLYLPVICLPINFKLLEKRELIWWKWRPIMWCGFIYCSPGFDTSFRDKRTWIHLNIHLKQARSHYITWPGYYISYWTNILLGFLWTGSWNGGKVTGKWECEAYGKEDDQDYLYNYQREMIQRYTLTLPERRELWKTIGEDREKWIEILKEM